MTVYAWAGVNSSDPTDPDNWSPSGIPGSGDDVRFNLTSDGAAFDCVLVADVTWGALTISSSDPDFFTKSFTDAGFTITLDGIADTHVLILSDEDDPTPAFTLNLTGKIVLDTGATDLVRLRSVANLIHDLEIRSGTVQIDASADDLSWSGAGLIAAAATLDFNGGDIAASGDLEIEAGATLANLGGRTIACGDFLSGADLNPGSAWALNAAGASRVATAGAIANSNASGSAGAIDATGGTATDEGGNTNWNFPAAPGGGTARGFLAL